MIEIKVVRNIILNSIDINDQPSKMHHSPPMSCQNFQIKKIQRLTNLRQIYVPVCSSCLMSR